MLDDFGFVRVCIRRNQFAARHNHPVTFTAIFHDKAVIVGIDFFHLLVLGQNGRNPLLMELTAEEQRKVVLAEATEYGICGQACIIRVEASGKIDVKASQLAEYLCKDCVFVSGYQVGKAFKQNKQRVCFASNVFGCLDRSSLDMLPEQLKGRKPRNALHQARN